MGNKIYGNERKDIWNETKFIYGKNTFIAREHLKRLDIKNRNLEKQIKEIEELDYKLKYKLSEYKFKEERISEGFFIRHPALYPPNWSLSYIPLLGKTITIKVSLPETYSIENKRFRIEEDNIADRTKIELIVTKRSWKEYKKRKRNKDERIRDVRFAWGKYSVGNEGF